MTTCSIEIFPGLNLAEEVLERIREVAEDSSLWFTAAMSGNELKGPAVPLHLALTRKEAISQHTPFKAFLNKHWRRAEEGPADETSFFVAANANPVFLEMRTEDREGLLDAGVQIIKKLNGLPVELEESSSWRWDRETLTSTGRPTHRTVYILRFFLGADKPFNAKAWLKTAFEHVTRGSDARAGRCAFELVEEAGLSRELTHSWSATAEGFEIGCASKASAMTVAQKVFADCETKTRKGYGYGEVLLSVKLPKNQSEARSAIKG